MRDIQQRLETDRRIAGQSTYWSCCCGLDHVPGCKVRRTEWMVKGGLMVLIILAFCYLVR